MDRSPATLAAWGVVLLGVALAVAGARPRAGSWNDGSRLAAVESLIERGTLRIDGSIYCDPARSPIPIYDDHAFPDLNREGTKDKLFIAGHYYSDKPAVISMLMAGQYRAGMTFLGLPSPGGRPDTFALVLTLATAGGAYLAALLGLYRLGGLVGLRGWARTAWLASFALATFALAYTRHVNNHVLLLAVVTGIALLAVEGAQRGLSWPRLAGLGTLAGLGFNLDLGSGPLLVLAVVGLVAWRSRRAGPVLACGLAALPWVAAGLALNYAIGGTLLPVSMVPEYSRWPGGPFSEDNLTGVWRNGPFRLPAYALALLVGKHGLLNHNLPLLLAVGASRALFRRGPFRAELVALAGWCVAGWAMYAALSNNYGGACCSVRWFVPFLAPLYLLLAVYLKDSPRRVADLAVLSAWGAVLGALMWVEGPWTLRMVPLLWPVTGAALVCWLALALARRARGPAASGRPLARAA